MKIFNIFKRDSDADTHSKKKADTNAKNDLTSETDVKIKPSDASGEKSDDMRKKGTNWTSGSGTYSRIFFPRVENKKLSIILLENTQSSAKVTSIISKIIHRLSPSDFVCVITYGSTVRVGRVKKVSKFDDSELLDKDDLNDKACLYDALRTLNKVVKIAFEKTRYDDFGINQYKINSIDIIGIGSGVDVDSKISREESLRCFDEILSKTGVETKYFCFSEEAFIEVASIGFRSIGAFPSKKKE